MQWEEVTREYVGMTATVITRGFGQRTGVIEVNPSKFIDGLVLRVDEEIFTFEGCSATIFVQPERQEKILRFYRTMPGYWGFGFARSSGRYWHLQIGCWLFTTVPA